MQWKQLGRFIPLALVILLIGIWSARTSLFEIYDSAVAANSKLNSAHNTAP